MRHARSFLACLLAFLFLCSPAVMAYTLPHTYTGDNGVVTIGVFEVAKWEHDTSLNQYDVFENWAAVKKSDRNVIFYDPSADKYIFCLIPEGKTATCTFTGSGVKLYVGSGGFSTLSFVRSGNRYVYSEGIIYSPYAVFPVFVVSSYFRNNPPYPSFPTSAMAEFGNAIAIEDDIGNPLPPLEEEDDTKGFWETLLGWLSSFWDKFISLFVPSEGFFDDWFAELRAAAMKKFGSLSKLSDDLNAAFEQMKNTTSSGGLILDIPANHLYKGFPGVRVDLLKSVSGVLGTIRGWLTAVCVVLTAIACYKRLIVLFEQ